MKPFRWNLAKREQLGRLTEGQRSRAYPEFIEELRTCASRLLAYSDDAYLAFVGRSPESLFDYLSGVFSESAKLEDFVLLNISNRHRDIEEIRATDREAHEALQEHFRECELSPHDIHHRQGKTCFTDLVYSGGTFGKIADFLFDWAREENVPGKELRLKLGFLGITSRTKTSPNTWRWQQRSEWVERLQVKNIRNVSVPLSLWHYLGDYQDKVSRSNHQERWASESILQPPRESANLEALRRAYDLYVRGQNERQLFSDLLCQEAAMTEDWFRKLVSDLRS